MEIKTSLQSAVCYLHAAVVVSALPFLSGKKGIPCHNVVTGRFLFALIFC